VKTITGHAAENWTASSAAHPGQRLPRSAPCQDEAGLYAYAAAPDTIPMPQPSPLTHQGPVATTARLRIVAAPSSSSQIKVAIAAAASSAAIKISKTGARVTAVIDVAKAATKDVAKTVATNVTKTIAQTVAKVAAKTTTKTAAKSGTTTVAKTEAKVISMAVKDIFKPEKTAKAATGVKAMSQQLAARKHKTDKMKFAKVAQR
jgi:hypothetical protein